MAAHRKGLTFPSVLIGQMSTEDLVKAKRSVRSEDTEAGRDVATFSGVCSLDVMHETLASARLPPVHSGPSVCRVWCVAQEMNNRSDK